MRVHTPGFFVLFFVVDLEAPPEAAERGVGSLWVPLPVGAELEPEALQSVAWGALAVADDDGALVRNYVVASARWYDPARDLRVTHARQALLVVLEPRGPHA